jgi:hypothetical protein
MSALGVVSPLLAFSYIELKNLPIKAGLVILPFYLIVIIQLVIFSHRTADRTPVLVTGEGVTLSAGITGCCGGGHMNILSQYSQIANRDRLCKHLLSDPNRQ